MKLTGVWFDTAFETDCLAISELDDDGWFQAIDSDGTICQYTLDMIVATYPQAL